MKQQVPLVELQSRMNRFRAAMDAAHPDWAIAAIVSKVNLYYFTGTMPNGLLLIPRDDEATFWVRLSHERALDESLFPNIRPMGSFRDAAASRPPWPDTVHLETEVMPLAFYQRFQKSFGFAHVRPADAQIGAVRAVKSSYELARMEQSGRIHQRVLEERVPEMLREGMSEVDLALELYALLVAEGHHGLARFGMFDTEMVLGLVAFGESSLYPTSFNGPGGSYGMSPAVPMLGSHERKLKSGDLVFIDIGCGVEGYHTDKTMTYMFGRPISDEAQAAHHRCVAIQGAIAAQLQPGAVPSQVYAGIMQQLDDGFRNHFMGYGQRRARFLGHGIGLVVDETPVLAEGFDAPLQEGMVLAVEPKKGVPDVGMVGIENTFAVTAQGGRCLTGDSPGLIPVGFSR